MENTVSTGTSDIDTSGGDCVPSDNFHSGTGKIREKITNREFNFPCHKGVNECFIN